MTTMKHDIKTLRKKLGDGNKPISQQKLARRLGVNQATVSRLEAGSKPTGPISILLSQIEAEVSHVSSR